MRQLIYEKKELYLSFAEIKKGLLLLLEDYRSKSTPIFTNFEGMEEEDVMLADTEMDFVE